jgi:type I restriction enzyme, R subunit
VRQIATTLDDYVFTPDDTVVEGEIEAGKRYEEADFNRIIEIREREKKRVEIFMGQIDPREKTLVFCANQTHALAIRDLINQIKRSSDPNYCQRVTADDGALGEQFLRDFQDNEKAIPTILTTSQKLSTGVDARNVRNIVLLRPINSMIEFKQIIGRGTRLYDGKDYFTIYDFVRAHHHFNDAEWDGEPLEPLTREERATRARAQGGPHFNDRQRAFLDFVLAHYVSIGVEELDQSKLTPLLKLKYHDSIADAVADLGKPEDIGRVFAGFQKFLYLTDTTP